MANRLLTPWMKHLLNFIEVENVDTIFTVSAFGDDEDKNIKISKESIQYLII